MPVTQLDGANDESSCDALSQDRLSRSEMG